MGTILDELKKLHPGWLGLDEANNISEALSGVKGIGEPIEECIDGFGKTTVLYSDGTLIINELAEDREANIVEHGGVVKEYEPWCTRQPYVFADYMDVPWADARPNILSVKFGSLVQPVSVENWFFSCGLCTDIDFTNLDTSNTTSFAQMFCFCRSMSTFNLHELDTSKATNLGGMFAFCSGVHSLDLSNFDTSNVTSMNTMFYGCSNLSTINLSSFDTSKVSKMIRMFKDCAELVTIFVSDKFITDSVTTDTEMFINSPSLVGGNRTVYSAEHINSEYARIDTEETPGYFTAVTEAAAS